jgi:8-oxo-dGTP pyrophosphatase MutT (NUDIX family)
MNVPLDAFRGGAGGGADGFDPHAVPLRDAATVMLVRDGHSGLEVFMVRRTLSAAFAGGMYVFPGGAVDAGDAGADVEPLCDGVTDTAASAQLELPAGGLAFWVAAIRECFEEAGVLLARRNGAGAMPDGMVGFDGEDVQRRFHDHRRAVHAGTLGLVELCQRESLRLATDEIRYVSHWVTPVGERRRFDTRFFLARAPQSQEPLHDDSETIESFWVSPAAALARFRAGELGMYPPTVSNLDFLLDRSGANDALAAAARIGIPPRIQPRLRFGEDGRIIGVVMPWDPGFDELPF